ncbi:WD40 repeat domain-containing protein [Salinisphaera sp. G21_0]|uniref:WD40 repeat domain-containing protein n=1 Tax=Salinisphaera sp. G21_0 TaxID=2821094 RepID=UPI001ADC26D0|nr:WD40 repeat domain-containing protein [Salinisphaera sp. G21_0]MBO9480280.1 WD40 repeat domain-containing protein [Salinisphaera sp. G21_0]
MQPTAASNAPAGRLEDSGQQVLEGLKNLHGAAAAFNKLIAQAPEMHQERSLKWLKQYLPPECFLTAVNERKVAGLHISMRQRSSEDGLSGVMQQHQQLQDVAVNNRQPDTIDPMVEDIFHCQTDYLRLEAKLIVDYSVFDASFSPANEYLVIHGCSRDGHRLGIWRPGTDGKWLDEHNWKSLAPDAVMRYQLNNPGLTILSDNHDGSVLVSKSKDIDPGQEEVALEHTPGNEESPKEMAGFRPLQDKIITRDVQTGKISVWGEDINGRWTPLTQNKEIRHWPMKDSVQMCFGARSNCLLTCEGRTATFWSCNDESKCLEEIKTIECNSKISSVQFSDDERHALILTECNEVVFVGCDADGNWLQIGEISHHEGRLNHLNEHEGSVVYASINATGQHTLTLDKDRKALISGYDDDGAWVVKTEMQDCAYARFSPSGRKLRASLYKPEGSNSETIYSPTNVNYKVFDCSRLKAQTLEHAGSSDIIFSPSENLLLSYGFSSNYACIWGDDGAGNLVEKARAGNYQTGISRAAFNAQEDSVLTLDFGKNVKIQGLDSQGKLQEQLLVVQHSDYIFDAQFSHSGSLAYSISLGTACILGREMNGEWIKLAQTNSTPGVYCIEGAHFNGPENHFLTYGNKLDREDQHQPGLVQLWGIDDDGNWVEKDKVILDHNVGMVKFSPDGDHLFIYCFNEQRDPADDSNFSTVLVWKIPATSGQETAHT